MIIPIRTKFCTISSRTKGTFSGNGNDSIVFEGAQVICQQHKEQEK